MCGRITQYQSNSIYAAELGWRVPNPSWDTARKPNWNLPPGASALLLHCFEEGRQEMNTVHWGYTPSWAQTEKRQVSNARIEKGAASPYFRSLWKAGRAIVPADGWYEWVGPKGNKQPWYIRLSSDRPMFLAALTDVRPDRELREGSGFVIVTAAADQGLIDIHDRRPVVLSADDAALWMDPDLPAEQAEHLARLMSLPPDAFTWYMVDRGVNNARNNSGTFIEPLTETQLHATEGPPGSQPD
ncbi:MAG: SOS response-associated peptidase family protein [Herminiimonas sp.]|nr:SOS response-associated peptidase family protein [Herminiimonas sp.]